MKQDEVQSDSDSEASGFSFDADEAITTKSDDDLTGSAIASQPAAKIDQASEFKLSSMQLILALIMAMLLILVAAWFVYDFKERLERWRRKFRRIQAKFSGSGSSNVEFPLAPVEPLKVAPAETSTVTDLSRSSNDTDLDSISALVSAQGLVPTIGPSRESSQVEDQQDVGTVTTELKEKSVSFEAEADLLQEQLKTAELEKETAKKELELLTSKVEQAESELETASQEMLVKTERIDTLESSLASLESQTQSLQEKLELAQAESSQSLARVAAAENDAKDLNQRLAAMISPDEVDALNQQLSDRTKLIEELELKLEQADAEAKVATQTQDEAENHVQTLSSELDRFKASEQQTQTELATAKKDLEEALANVTQSQEKLENQLAQHESQMLELSSSKADLENKLAIETSNMQQELQGSQKSLAEQKTQHQTAIESLKASHQQALDTQIEQNKQTVANLESKIAHTNLELETARQEIEEAVASVTQSQEELETVYDENVGKTETADRLLRENEGLNSDIEKLREQLAQHESQTLELSNLKADLENKLATETSSLQQELQGSQKSLAEQEAQHQATIESLKSSHQQALDTQIKENEQTVAGLESKIDHTRSELTTAKKDLEEAVASVTQSQDKLEATYDEIAGKTETADRLLRENDGLKSDVEKLENQLAQHESQTLELSNSKADLESRLATETSSLRQELQSSQKLLTELRQSADVAEQSLADQETKHQAAIESLRTSHLEALDTQIEQKKQTVAELESNLDQTHSELTAAKKGLKAATDSVAQSQEKLEAAYDEIASKTEAVDRLLRENDGLKYDVENLESQLVQHESQALELSNLQAGLESKLATETSGLHQELQRSQKSLAEQEAQHQTAIENLKTSHQQALSSQVEQNEQTVADLESKIDQTHSELAVAQENVSKLEAKVANQSELFERNKKLQQQLDQINQSTGDSADQIDSLTAVSNELKLKTKEFEQRAREAEDELARTHDLLETEQTLTGQLKQTVAKDSAELSLQVKKYAELERKLLVLEESHSKTEQLLKDEQSARAKMASTVQQKKDRQSDDANQILEMESEIESLKQLNQVSAKQLSEAQESLRHNQSRTTELEAAAAQHSALLAERETKYKNLELELESATLRADAVDKQVETAGVSQSDYDELMQKAVKYKTACLKNKSFADELRNQKASMKELAAKYLAVAKDLRKELDDQLYLNAQLKQKLGSTPPSSAEDTNQLVRQHAREHVLKLKSQFEAKIKKKNELIRKLQERTS